MFRRVNNMDIPSLIRGCIIIFLLIPGLILKLYIQSKMNTDGYITGNGVITESNPEKKEVTVAYTINNRSYTSAYNCEAYAAVGEMPPVDLKVQVIVDKQNPEIIAYLNMLREAGRGTGGNRKYIDNQSKRPMILAFIGLFLYALCEILEGLTII